MFSLDDIDELPDLVQVGTVLLPEFFHLAAGTVGMWSEGWPGSDDFALFLHFHVFEGELLLTEARSAGVDLPVAYEKFRKVVPARRWKSMAVALMTRYLAAFMEEERRPDEDMEPAHGARSVVAYESRPGAAMRWVEKLRDHTAEAYAVRDRHALPSARRKRNRITDDFLREVAVVYVTADGIGSPPTRAVASHFEAPHSTAAKWVSSARRKNFLPPPGQESQLEDQINRETDPAKKAKLEDTLRAAKLLERVFPAENEL